MADDLTEQFCLGSLARALDQPVPPQSASYWGDEEKYGAMLAKARAVLAVADKADNSVFTMLYSLLSEMAADEEWFGAVGTDEISATLDGLYASSKDTLSYYIMPAFYATRMLSRLHYGKLQFAEPSINVGMGEGVSSAFAFGGRTMEVGADLGIHDVIDATTRGGYRRYFAFDGMNVPFVDGSFATAVCMNTVYHMNDRRRAVSELARIVGSGGSIYFDDAQDAIVQRPIPLMFSSAGFEKGGRAALVARTKPQATLTKAEYEDFLRSLGFSEIDVRPMMSLPLYRLILFFVDLEHMLGYGRPKVSPAHEDALQKFLRNVLAPMLAADQWLTQRHGGLSWFVAARKSGTASYPVRTRCPSCHTQIDAPYRCRCGISYPTIKDVPLLSETYARLWEAFTAPN